MAQATTPAKPAPQPPPATPKPAPAQPRTTTARQPAPTAVAGMAIVAADSAMRPFMDRPEKPASQLKDWTGRMIETLPSDQSRYVSQFYEQAKVVQETYALYQRQVANGDREGALATKTEYASVLQAEPRVNAFEKQMSELRAAMRKVEANRDLDSDAKRTKLNLLNSRLNTIAEKAARVTNSAVQ